MPHPGHTPAGTYTYACRTACPSCYGPCFQPVEGEERGAQARPAGLLPAPGFPEPRGSSHPSFSCCCCHCVQFASLQYPPSIQVLHPVRASRWGPEQFTAAKPQETLPNFIAPSLWPPSSPGELQSRRPVSSASDNPVFAKGNRHYLRGPPCWEWRCGDGLGLVLA